jgi:hypothetical protein
MRLARLAPLLLVAALGCAFLGPPDPARKADGMWQERFATADGGTKLVSLWLQPEGRATLETVTLGKARTEPQGGHWSFRDDNQLTVQLQNAAGEDVGQPLVFDLVGDKLVPKKWDQAVFGKDGIPLRRRIN